MAHKISRHSKLFTKFYKAWVQAKMLKPRITMNVPQRFDWDSASYPIYLARIVDCLERACSMGTLNFLQILADKGITRLDGRGSDPQELSSRST
ncbi:hypothetical protein M0657_001898 [Pyricularia oryzae]|nr:hypothetical protein M9X92_001358 [Pyricularia oryzae]KAI7930093.1 hypothetical protein M0657_001898 [Pyricularia oryzae]